MFKFKNKKLPSNFDGYFQEAGEHHNYNLRSSNQQNYQQSRVRTSYGQRKIQNDGAKIWNETPIAIKECKNLKNFSGLYKAFLLNTQT